MKIAYLIHWNEGRESGVFKKVVGQIAEWNKSGHEIALFLFTNKPLEHEWKSAIASDIELFIQSYEGNARRFKAFRCLTEQVEQWKPDVLYHRFDLYYYSLPKLLKKFPSVIEINTNDLQEMGMNKNIRYYFHKFTRAKILKAVGGLIYVSKELSNEIQYSRYGKDWIVIGNGIHLDEFNSSPPSSTDQSVVRFIFIGSAGQSWQGVDAIIALANKEPNWHYDVVGIERDEIGPSVPDNVHFHGKLPQDKYQQLMDRADVAIGTIALYRKKMEEASPLKVREYLANGLPVVIAYEDTDFPIAPPFILRLPNEPNSLIDHLDQIQAFVTAWVGKRVEREAIHHLDTSVKEAVRLQYMQRIRVQRWS